MKGQTIIELKDVKTGKKERYVDENMITNGVAEFLKTCALMNNANTAIYDSLVTSLLGGIMCFDTAQTENVATVYPSTSSKMIANGANGYTNSSTTTEMGSFNSAESGWQGDGSYVQVFDFTTSQANGDIACVCLSSKAGAYMGWGNNTSNEPKTTSVEPYIGVTQGYKITNYKIVTVDYTESCVYMVKNLTRSNILADSKIKVEKFYLPLSKINLKGTTTELAKVSETEYTVPQTYLDYLTSLSSSSTLSFTHDSDGNAYIVPSIGTWADNGSISFLKVNKTGVAVHTLQNTTGVNLNQYTVYNFEHGYCIAWNKNNNKVYRISLTDSSSVEITGYVPAFSNITITMLKCKGGFLL